MTPAAGKATLIACPHSSITDLRWNVADWGTITVNPFMDKQGVLNRGDTLDLGVRILAHDKDVIAADVADLYEEFKSQSG